MVDSDVGTCDFSLVPGILQVCGNAHVRSSVSLDIDCILMAEKMKKRAESNGSHFLTYRLPCSLDTIKMSLPMLSLYFPLSILPRLHASKLPQSQIFHRLSGPSSGLA